MFVDLSKAFDTVDHQILLKKLEYDGIAGNNLRWFENYLKDSQQFISFENNSAKKVTITCGVPQGSILGPLLLLLYVNDLHIITYLEIFHNLHLQQAHEPWWQCLKGFMVACNVLY